ncbi:MAG: hypothetical protein IM568_04150 [Flavobacterium sp.]|nr:hypothetical protein [Flavobacterium sp.]
MSKKVKILIGVIVVVAIGYFGYNYIMTAGARDIQTEKSEYTKTATDIFTEFSNNSEIATKKYLNKTVQVSGKVTTIGEDLITLDEKVSCQLQVSKSVAVGSQIIIKGRVTGYDDLLEELKLDLCLIVK